MSFDLLVKNVRLVRPHHSDTPTVDLGIRKGRFVCIDPNQDDSAAAKVVRATKDKVPPDQIRSRNAATNRWTSSSSLYR